MIRGKQPLSVVSFTENIYLNQKKKILEIMNNSRPKEEIYNNSDITEQRLFQDIKLVNI